MSCKKFNLFFFFFLLSQTCSNIWSSIPSLASRGLAQDVLLSAVHAQGVNESMSRSVSKGEPSLQSPKLWLWSPGHNCSLNKCDDKKPSRFLEVVYLLWASKNLLSFPANACFDDGSTMSTFLKWVEEDLCLTEPIKHLSFKILEFLMLIQLLSKLSKFLN